MIALDCHHLLLCSTCAADPAACATCVAIAAAATEATGGEVAWMVQGQVESWQYAAWCEGCSSWKGGTFTATSLCLEGAPDVAKLEAAGQVDAARRAREDKEA